MWAKSAYLFYFSVVMQFLDFAAVAYILVWPHRATWGHAEVVRELVEFV